MGSDFSISVTTGIAE